jgi:hypothetical protein
MAKISDLRQHGGFPGGLVNALEDLDARITALEAYKPMLEATKPEWDAHVAAEAEPAADIVGGTNDEAPEDPAQT